MEEISLTMDGRMLNCSPGSTLLEAAEENGIKIPTLCHHPELKPAGACRLCLVEDEKSGRVMAACVTPIAQDMVIRTDSSRVMKHRKNIIRLMMAEHPESCLICSKGNRCRLRELAAKMGLGETGLYPMPNFKPVETLNPFVERDLTKCILCGKCIRADHELVVTGAIDYNQRGFTARPATLLDKPLEDSSCTFCGTCVAICPTGALSTKAVGYVGSPLSEDLSTCGFCGVGCSLLLGVSGERVVEVNPSNFPKSVNGATLCVRGHFGHDYLNSTDRLNTPLIRKEDELIPVTWEEAYKTVADRLRSIRKRHGPQSIGFLGSSKCTNEENYLFQRMSRIFLGSNNVDRLGDLGTRPSVGVLQERTGWGCRKAPMAGLERSEAILVLGADPDQSTPVLSYHLKRAARKGIPIIGVDLRRTLLTPFSSAWLCINPGRDLEFIHCLTALLWKKFGHNANFIERFTTGFEAFSEAISSFNPERLCLSVGSDMASLEGVANLLKGRRISFLIGHGITGQANGPKCMDAILNLALMTGSISHENAGIYIIAHENNQTGAWDMGSTPDMLPGRLAVKDKAARKIWGRAWKAHISPDPGLNALRMIEEAEKGNLKALYVMGENPLRSLPQRERVLKALRGLDFLVVQDILSTETVRIGDVVLPGAAFSEKEGSFTSMEGRINRFKQVAKPPGKSLPDWQILDQLGKALGDRSPYGSIHRIREEIARALPQYQSLTEASDNNWSWIRTNGNTGSSDDEKAGSPIPFAPLGEMEDVITDDSHPITAVLGTERRHLGSGTRTTRSGRITRFDPDGTAAISFEDAQKLGVAEGNRVRLISGNGHITRKVRIDKGLPRGILFLPTGTQGNDALNLLALKPFDGPGYEGVNTCQVRLELMGGEDGTKTD